MKRKCRSRANVAEGRRILLAVGSTGMTAHDFLYGFSRYYRTKSDWHLDLDFARDIPVPGRRTSGNDVYDGIVSDATVLDAKLLSRSGPDTRIVLFGDLRADLDGRKMAYVQTDDTAIGRLGAQSLLSLGNFMSFGYVPVANESKWSARRGRGFAEALSEAGRSCVSFRGKDEAEIDSYLRGLPKPAAVLCACDAVARAVVERCKSCRIRIPEEVSVLGVDNDEITCQLTYPALSSMQMDVQRAGYDTAQMIEQMKRDPSYKGHDISVQLIGVMERNSTDFFAAKDPNVQKALNYIYFHLNSIKSVTDGMSAIMKQFQKTLDDLGVKEIPAEGQKFDPKYHEAVMRGQNPDLEEDTIDAVFEKGYELNDKVIRHSKVRVISKE